MCGILGSFVRYDNWSESVISNSLLKINHRGPNNSSYRFFDFNQHRLTLGHTRLSIFDLSNAGNQPMSLDNNNLCVIYNGEIYNYLELKEKFIPKNIQFKTNTDTEVLLYLWKLMSENCLKH